MSVLIVGAEITFTYLFSADSVGLTLISSCGCLTMKATQCAGAEQNTCFLHTGWLSPTPDKRKGKTRECHV